MLANGQEEQALQAASSAVRRVANAQQTSSDNGFRLIEALEAAEAAFDIRNAAADAPGTSPAPAKPASDTVATSTVATSGTNARVQIHTHTHTLDVHCSAGQASQWR